MLEVTLPRAEGCSDMLHVYRTREGMVVCRDSQWMRLPEVLWDDWFRADDPIEWLGAHVAYARTCGPPDVPALAPLVSQEVWAAGVTYFRSRSARMEESDAASDCYDRVYDAERPELFFKATPHRVVGTEGQVRIRCDARWKRSRTGIDALSFRGRQDFRLHDRERHEQPRFGGRESSVSAPSQGL